MKRYMSRIAVLLTALILLASFMTVPAFAAGITGDLPSIRTVTDGDNVTFSLAIDGTAVDVQWFRNGSASPLPRPALSFVLETHLKRMERSRV